MALTCLVGGKAATGAASSEFSLEDTLGVILKRILEQQQSDGTIGNIYSTGLAAQALTAAWRFYPVDLWSCTKTLAKVLSEIPQDTFSIPTAASQVLPFLKGKTYLDAGKSCTPENVPSITVDYTILNDLVGKSFKFSIQVSVPEGSVLLDVMKKAEQMNSQDFSFKTDQTSQGLFVTTIHGLAGSNKDRTFWQFFSGVKPLIEGSNGGSQWDLHWKSVPPFPRLSVSYIDFPINAEIFLPNGCHQNLTWTSSYVNLPSKICHPEMPGVGAYKPKSKEHIMAIFSKY